MKNTLRIEYNSVSKRYEVSTDNGDEIGRIYRSGKQYEVYLRNRYIGFSTNPYSGKQLIFDTLYPDEKQLREERKQKREIERQRKEEEKQKKQEAEKIAYDASVMKMNEIRENAAFRLSFSEAFKIIFPEHRDKTLDNICQADRIMMNGIALHIIGGQDDINKAIRRNYADGKILKIMLGGGLLENIDVPWC
jgi:hypothetical protein